MAQGKIVEYVEQGRFICALCLEDKGNRFHLLTPLNREISLAPKRAVLISPSDLDTTWPREELLGRLREREQARMNLKAQVDAREIWELVRDENEIFDNRYLAHLAFGESITDDHRSAVVRALFENRLYFKMKDGHFLPHSQDKVEQIIKQQEAEALRAERLRHGGLWLGEIRKGNQPQDPPCREAVVQDLIELALYENAASDLKYKKELLSNAGVEDIREVRDLLVRLGVWEEDENRDLLRLGVDTVFTPDQLHEASRLAASDFNREGREDLRDLSCMTIDSALTRDYDDAMSLKVNGDRIHLGVHIADVADVITPGSLLDQAARQRASSHYLPRRQIPMIPEVLSQDALSLKQGCDRPAVSLLATFDPKGRLLDHRFTRSVIRVRRQLSYTAVEEIYEKEESLTRLSDLSQTLRQQRMNQGALNLSLPELEVRFNPDQTVSLEFIEQDTRARMIVAEIMILYNWLAAKFCQDHQIPVLFRTQPEPSEKLPLDEKGYLYYVFQQRRKLSPLQVQTAPGPHAGLGMPVYTHATSPIRRYLDLLTQHQLKGALSGQAPSWDEKELEEIRLYVEPVIKNVALIKRNRLRYWTLKFLSQHQGEQFAALVLDELKRKYRILLEDVLMIADLKRQNGIILSQGQKIRVRVKKADPWEDMLTLEYVKEA
ncbi:MAG: RNB domain-containing ribonuclease [Desulfobacteraceae bacterium]